MKYNRQQLIVSILLGITLMLLINCEYEGPDPILKPVPTDRDDPVITEIVPADVALPGVLEIKIVGENFYPALDTNVVYINGQIAHQKRATADTITIYRPTITGSGLRFAVNVPGAWVIAEKDGYEITEVTSEYGRYVDTETILTFCLDADQNIYGLEQFSYSIIKTTPDGIRSTYFVTDVKNVKDAIKKATTLRITPDKEIMMAHSKNSKLYIIHHITADSMAADEYTTMPAKTPYIDYDVNGNMFAGGEGLYVVNPDTVITTLSGYDGFNIIALRVAGDTLYVAGTAADGTTVGIWKNKILSSDGQLGANIPVVANWANTGEYAGSALNGIIVSENGDVYVGTDHVNPILIIHSNGDMEPLYTDILSPTANEIIWGSGTYLYIRNSTAKRVYKVAVGLASAPAYFLDLD